MYHLWTWKLRNDTEIQYKQQTEMNVKVEKMIEQLYKWSKPS